MTAGPLKSINLDVPANYFPGDDPDKTPKKIWRGHANLLFSNWLNHFVYQDTPYNIEEIDENTIPFSFEHQSQQQKEK